jgi:hypothetical protein
MRNPWNTLRCRLTFHRWETFRDGTEKGVECRDCKWREFAHEVTPGERILGGMRGQPPRRP